MPDTSTTNAYDYLRASIAGTAGQPRSATTDFTAIQPDELVYRDPFSAPQPAEPQDFGPIPPILTLPPGVDLLDFVGRVERAHDIHYTDDQYLERSRRGPQGNSDHAVDLLDNGMVALYYGEFALASDIFSLCLILDPNYFYHFCLATARFGLGDFDGSLGQLRKAMELIRAKQEIRPEVFYYQSKMLFSDEFYKLYITCLIYTGKKKEAEKMADFVIQSDALRDAMTYLELAYDFSDFNNLPYAAKMIDKMMPAMGDVGPETQKFLLNWTKNILKGEPWKTGKLPELPQQAQNTDRDLTN